MAMLAQGYIFDWQQVDSASDLDRLKLVLEGILDTALMETLEYERGRGRDDYPVRAVWNSVLAGVVFQHPTIESLRRELRRNGQLRHVCGFDPLLGEKAVPTAAAYSRFIELVIKHEPDVRAIFHAVLEALRAELPDLGCLLADDGKALPSFGKPIGRTHKDTAEKAATDNDAAHNDTAEKDTAHKHGAGNNDRRRDNDADWGVKSYRGVHADGSKWEKITKWFGFKLHLLIDSANELPIDYAVTKASVSDMTHLLPLVAQAANLHPEILGQATQLAADKGYDSTENCRELYDAHGIKPIIDKRSDWKDGEKTRSLYPDRADSIVYDVRGTVSCICPCSGEQRHMAPWGFEADRGTIKYRCPAAAFDFECQGRDQCTGAQTQYGRIVRIHIDDDRRMFTPIARDSEAWQTAYDRRSAVERVNSRIDNLLGFEHHTIRGIDKMQARIGIALVVLLSMALGRIRAGQAQQMRSMVGPVQRAA